jgi:myo-inositol-1(or 4)-monophosphatase
MGQGMQKGDIRFIVDPLDGTSNFLHALPHWAISIAMERNGEVVAALVHDPVKNEMFHATKNGGAFSGRQRLRVSSRTDLMRAMIATGAPRRSVAQKNQFIREYGAVLNVAPGLRRYGAAALDLAYVAAGRYDGFWERDLKAWDIAAGILLVREAGGMVCDLDKDNLNPVNTGNVLSASAASYDSLKKVLRAVQKED